MADKINIQDAAKLLNIDVERLQFLSRTGEIHGKQEDNGTVFTYDELRRYADSTGIEIGEAPLDSLDLSDDDDSILVDEPPVSPTEGGSGTVIDDAPGTSPDSSDLNLGDSIELELELDDSDELSLDLEEGDLDPEDKTLFAEGGDEGLSASDLAALSLDLDDDDQIAPEDDTQFGAGGDDSGLEVDEILNLDLGGSSDDETQFAIGNEGFKVAEDEIVLGGEENILTSEESSDIGLAAGNSGINITSPHDSGISLEGGALDLAGGSGSSLELPGADEEFMLGGSPEDEMSDSGSQVIALS
ncbi:MAG: hypothetical protein VX738_15780, partial [Planctomycetota bacterium]|nr:hypothetical protein [Planctomycetota bacterium]